MSDKNAGTLLIDEGPGDTSNRGLQAGIAELKTNKDLERIANIDGVKIVNHTSGEDVNATKDSANKLSMFDKRTLSPEKEEEKKDINNFYDEDKDVKFKKVTKGGHLVFFTASLKKRFPSNLLYNVGNFMLTLKLKPVRDCSSLFGVSNLFNLGHFCHKKNAKRQAQI